MTDTDGQYNGVTPDLSADLNDDNLKLDFDDEGVSCHINLSKLLPTRKEKSQVTEAMVIPIYKGLYDATPYDAYDKGFKNGSTTKQLFGKSVRHLREGITHKPNQYIDGSTQLGFKRGYYPVAIWTDRGTINQKPQYWFEQYVANLPAEEAFSAGIAKAEEILGRKLEK